MTLFRRKLLHFFLTVVVVSAITFAMIDLLPGDAAIVFTGPEASVETVAAIRHEMGLDAPAIVRYFRWTLRAVSGDRGVPGHPGTGVGCGCPSPSNCCSLPSWAILCARKPDGTVDRMITTVSFASLSIPNFVMAILLVFFFVLRLRWLPATSFAPLADGLAANVRSLLLPGLSIALVEWVILFRVLRSDLITTLGEDFILMARAKGLGNTQVLFRHALRPSSLNLLTVIGLQMGHLIGGVLVVETIFALPGIGRLLVTAIYSRDIFMIQGCALWITLGYVSINLMVDVLYAVLDPRIRLERANV